MTFNKVIIVLFALQLIIYHAEAQQMTNEVKVIGQMKNVMWKGELFGNINLDTIANKSTLYGLGPVEHLTGEILIIDGKSYKATVLTDTTVYVEETYKIKAPFFGYTNIEQWKEQPLPDSIQTIPQLEQYLDKITTSSPRPFMFKLFGIVEHATIHIVNLPKGLKVNSPADAHNGQINYQLKNEPSEIIGFFSTDHKAIFTHHDSFLHMHLITVDRQKMGHLDDVIFKKKNIKLYLPQF